MKSEPTQAAACAHRCGVLGNRLAWALVVALLTAGPGCAQFDSTTKRAGAVSLGAAAGGAAGYEIGDGSAAATGAGAVAGAALTHLALGRDKAVLQEGFDEGYVQGQSDAIKRQYFLRQALEKRPLKDHAEGTVRTYYLPAPTGDSSDAKSEPRYLAVRVVE